MKTLFDITISFFAIVLLIPFGFIIAIIIKIDSKGPVFFKQVRVGKDHNSFKIYKFRTMITDAEKKGLQLTVGIDPRITPIGHFLRKYKIDELPQLINVLIGDMSFVGPRPEVPKYVDLYNEKQKKVLEVKPGLTDLASIEYINENYLLTKCTDPEKMYIETIMPKKLELNLKYIKENNFSKDIKIILRTILRIIKK